MGKAGRFACILTPMLLTLASLICIILVGAGTTGKTGTLSNFYFMRADTSNFTESSSLDLIPGTNLDNGLIKTGLNGDVTLADFYDVGLWNYCSGNKTGNDTFDITFCSSRQAQYWFNPLDVWGLNTSSSDIPKSVNSALNTYEKVSKFMFIAYIVAFVATLVELVFGFFAICSRWGSFVVTIVSTVSSIFILAASITSTALFATLVGTFDSALKNTFHIEASLGRSMFITTWLAVLFSWAAGLFWLFSVCCCSGRSSSPRNRNPRVEKTPYTYEPVVGAGAPYAQHQRGFDQSIPLENRPGESPYEPYRHSNIDV